MRYACRKTDRQTDKTDTLVNTILHSPTGAEYVSNVGKCDVYLALPPPWPGLRHKLNGSDWILVIFFPGVVGLRLHAGLIS